MRDDFEKYLKVQASGKYKMYDPRVSEETGLSPKRISYIMSRYDELVAQYEDLYIYYMKGGSENEQFR